jgi:hypothetical protein
MFPHINLDHAPDWVRYTYASCAAIYAIIMLTGAFILYRKGKIK